MTTKHSKAVTRTARKVPSPGIGYFPSVIFDNQSIILILSKLQLMTSRISVSFVKIFYPSLIILLLCNSCNGVRKKPDDKVYNIQIPTEFPLSQLNAYTNILNDQYHVGRGLKTGTYDVMQTAIDTSNLNLQATVPGNSGLTDVRYQYATDYTSLRQSLGLNLSLNAKVGWFSVEASMNNLQSSVQNSLSTFLIAKVVVTNSTKTILNPKLTVSAQRLLGKNPQEFYNNYGDRFISGMVTGGELDVIYEFLATSMSEKQDLAINVKMSASNLNNSVEAVMNYTKSLQSDMSSKKVKVHIIRFGDKSDLPKDDLDSMLTFIKTFPSKVTPSSGNETFRYFTTDKYIAAAYTSLLANKQNDLDLLAEKQRKVYQLLSWKQEMVNESIKSTDFALDTTVFQYDGTQYALLKIAKDNLRDQYERIDDCYTKCKDITQCEDCKKIISETTFNPDFTAFKPVRKFGYKLKGQTTITYDENNVAILEPNSKYKLEFSGMVLAPGSVPFQAFVSPDNNRRAVQVTIPQGILALTPRPCYPIIYVKIFNNGSVIEKPLTISDTAMYFNTSPEITIRGSLRYYASVEGKAYDVRCYLDPVPGKVPMVNIYKWE
jgi:hypothetical protein